jgi:hypothetical protein
VYRNVAASGVATSSGVRSCACGTLGELADYQAGLYGLKVHNVADYRRGWGNDAGAWFATTAVQPPDRAVNLTAASAAVVRCCKVTRRLLMSSTRRPVCRHPERERRGIRSGAGALPTFT